MDKAYVRKLLRYRTLCAASTTLLAFAPEQALAYRPFKSTDADVVDRGEIEIEIGALTVERENGETGYITPALILNYGLTKRLEVVGEFEIEKPAGRDWAIADPGLFLKTVLKDGVLQERPGLSVAAEFGALLPSTKTGEKGIGGEGILIFSHGFAPFAWHANLGGGVNRAGDAFWTWGAIGEAALSQSFTLVAEIVGEDAAGAEPERSALIGARVQPRRSHVVFDIGVRRGLARASPDWTATFGLTTSF